VSVNPATLRGRYFDPSSEVPLFVASEVKKKSLPRSSRLSLLIQDAGETQNRQISLTGVKTRGLDRRSESGLMLAKR
jgi:hypothetical protein